MLKFIRNYKLSWSHIALCLFTVGMALGMKYHYSHASSDTLEWILRPTAGLVASISGKIFIKESGAGYISFQDHAVIAPSCAGINFLITAFCMAAFGGLFHWERFSVKVFWIGASLAGSYVLTLYVNAVRILLSIYLYKLDIYSGWVTPERVHRILGCLIYFTALSVFYLVLLKMIQKKPKTNDGYMHVARSGLIPLGWYGLIGLGIPLLNNGFFKNRSLFIEHCGIVFSLSLVVFIVIFLIRSIWLCQVTRSRK